MTGEPIEARFIDFQLTRVVPPVVDVSHLLCLSASKSVIDDMEFYLEIYYASLSDFLKELGTNSDVVYPHEVFMKQWKNYGKFGPTMMLFALRFILSEENEAPSLTSNEECTKSLLIDEMVNQAENDRRIIDVFKKFVAAGWI